jgi:hypothetical protein
MLLASVAMAGQLQSGYAGSGYGAYQTNQGGEFTLNPINPTGWLDLSDYSAKTETKTKNIGVDGTFQTFCIEGNEYIYPYAATYNVSIDRNAIDGGGNTTPDGDPLSVGTGWLYSKFASGNWSGSTVTYSYEVTDNTTLQARKSDADLLQKALWWLEGEETSIAFYDSNNKYMVAVLAAFGQSGDTIAQAYDRASANGGWHYGVYALNIKAYPSSGSLDQTQLYYHVPDGGLTVILLGLSLGGLAFLSRKFA